MYIHRTGQDVQKAYTMKQLPVLLETYREEALTRIVPKICVRIRISIE